MYCGLPHLPCIRTTAHSFSCAIDGTASSSSNAVRINFFKFNSLDQRHQPPFCSQIYRGLEGQGPNQASIFFTLEQGSSAAGQRSWEKISAQLTVSRMAHPHPARCSKSVQRLFYEASTAKWESTQVEAVANSQLYIRQFVDVAGRCSGVVELVIGNPLLDGRKFWIGFHAAAPKSTA